MAKFFGLSTAMEANTILLDLTVETAIIKSDGQKDVVADNIETILRDFLANLRTVYGVVHDGGLVKFYTGDRGVTAQLRIYPSGLITVTIEFFKGHGQEPPILDYEKTKQLESLCKDIVIGIKQHKSFVPIHRGAFYKYYPTSDDRLLEYDIDDLVFEEVSPFQKIQIVHSKSLGNMLVLDDLQNISEADLIYTETLMAKGKESYANKEIIILGGGDGALLYELLKENPKEVVMLEIDDVVMRACSKYMRSICGNVLDTRVGPNYQIIVGDCMETLEGYAKEDRKFDYIFGDLTDVPISDTLSGQWTFINTVLQMSFAALKPTGKFMTHLIGSSSPASIEMYKTQLQKIKPAVTYTTSKAFVPSFMEEWVFCQIGFLNPSDDDDNDDIVIESEELNDPPPQ